MNSSASTVTGKIKIKIVFLGNQAVGKSSIIDRYVNDRFDETAHVLPSPPSPPSVSTSSPKTSSTRPRATVCSSGTLLGRNASEPSSQVTSETPSVPSSFSMWPAGPR